MDEQVPAADAGGLDEAKQGMAEAAEELRQLFSTLVPPETIELRDAFGGVHKVRSALPARAQIRVMQQLDALLAARIDTSALALVAQGGGVEGVATALISLAQQPAVLDGLAAAFTAAHPSVVAQAIEAGRAVGVEVADAADAFPAEELVAGLVPFGVRSASRLIELATGMAPA